MLDEQSRRRLQGILDDPLFQDIWAAVEADYIASWKSAKTPGEREEAWMAVAVMSKLKTLMERRAKAPPPPVKTVKKVIA